MARNVRQPGEQRLWALFCRPDVYDAAAAIASGRADTWLINRGDVRAGDQAIIWQGLDRQGRRGVIAFAEILTDPADLGSDSDHWVSDPIPGPRVRIQYRSAPNLPLLFESRHLPPELTALSVSRAQGNTVFRVTPEQWDAVTSLAGGLEGDHLAGTSPEIEAAGDAIRILSGRSSQGFQVDSVTRLALEDYAMSIARHLLERDGWTTIADVHATRSYDLHCSRDHDDLRVEVKGTQSLGEAILVTRNEVRHAREHNVELIIVHSIGVTSEASGCHVAGGTVRRIRPWCPEDEDLRALGYTWAVPPAS